MADDNLEWINSIARGNGNDLLRFLRSRLANVHDAEDLAQEVYLRLLRVKNPTDIRNRRAYVLRVAANVVHEWRLLARNRLRHMPDPLEYMANDDDTAHAVEIDRQMLVLYSALDTLTPKCRAVLLMHRRDRYTYDEIATRMGMSVSMVKKYLVKGLSICQERLSREVAAAPESTSKARN